MNSRPFPQVNSLDIYKEENEEREESRGGEEEGEVGGGGGVRREERKREKRGGGRREDRKWEKRRRKENKIDSIDNNMLQVVVFIFRKCLVFHVFLTLHFDVCLTRISSNVIS